MKIAVVIDTWFPAVGGGQINALEISKRIAKKGVKVDVITRNNGSYRGNQVKNLRIIRLGKKSDPNDNLSRLFFLIRSFFFIRNKNYDLVHLHAFLPGLISPLILLFLKRPTVFTVHGTSINTNLNNLISLQIEKFILTKIRYTAQITVSQDFLKIENVNKQSFSTNKNITYIPNGVDFKAFDKIKVTKFKDPTLIFVGRLHPQKNLKNLVAAIEVIKVKVPNIRLLIVGKGGNESELREQIENRNLSTNIKFLGFKTGNDLIKLYKASHVFVLPSIYEGQPLVLLEALAAKLPIVASRVGGIPWIVKNNINGFLFPPQNLERLASAIFEALKSRNRLALYDHRKEKVTHDWNRIADSTLKLYKTSLKYH